MPSIVPALLMVVVGGVGIRRPSLGWDENATWMISGRTVEQILATADTIDGVIAPYYLFMHFWTGLFGDSELALRAPSLLAVAAGVGIAGELGRRLFSPGVGLFGAVLLVAVPQLTRYAQDARVYGIAFLLATLSTLLLYLALTRPTWSRWVLYGLTVCLLGLAHMICLLVLAGHLYAVATRWSAGRDHRLLRWVAVTVVALLPIVPLMVIGLGQRGNQLDWIAPMTLNLALAAPGVIFGFEMSGTAVGLLLIGLAMAVRWAHHRPVRELAVLALVPPVVVVGVSFVTSSIWVPRYVMFVVPAVTLLAAAALRGMRVRAGLALVLLVVLSVPSQREFRGSNSHSGTNFREAAKIVAKRQRPGDGIVYGVGGSWSLRAGMDYQLRHRDKPRDLLLTRSSAEVGGLDAEQCADPVKCLGTTRRVWLVRLWPTDRPLSEAGALRPTLTKQYRQVRMWQIAKGTVALYERK